MTEARGTHSIFRWLEICETSTANPKVLDQRYAFAAVGTALWQDFLCQEVESGRTKLDALLVFGQVGECPPPNLESFPSVDEHVFWSDAPTIEALSESYTCLREFLEKSLSGNDNSSLGLLDASALTKANLGYVLGLLIRTRAVKGLDLLYRPAEYEYKGLPLSSVYKTPELSRQINDIEFELAAVPYVEGKYNPAKKRHVILLAGLDYQRAYWKVKELEPSLLDVIVDETVVPGCREKTFLHELRKRLDEDISRALCCSKLHVGSTMRALSHLLDGASRPEVNGLQPMLVGAGWKPHLIASALHSVMESEAPLLVTIPDRVVPMQIKWAKQIAIYRLRDRANLDFSRGV